MVYEVIDDELVVLPEISETMAKIEILDPSKVCFIYCIEDFIMLLLTKEMDCIFFFFFFRHWFLTLAVKYIYGMEKT